MSGGKKETTNQTTTSGPSAAAQPFWNKAYQGASQALDATPKNQNDAVGALRNWANAGTGQAQGDVRGAIGQLQQGYNPVDVSAQIKSAINPYEQMLTEKILPQARSQSIAQGAYDSPRGDITSGQLIRDNFTNPVTDIIGKYQSQENQAQRDYGLQAGSQISGLNQAIQGLQLAPAQAMMQANQLQAAAPWQGLGEYSNILNALPSTTQATTVEKKQNGDFWGDLLKGAVGGAMMFSGKPPGI